MPNWDKVKTKNNYKADEIISLLQKAIRRGEEELAVFAAYEMLITSDELADKCWQRLRVIATEDIGLANPDVVPQVMAAHDSYKLLHPKEDKNLHAIFATVLLARSPKSRYIDELYNNLKQKVSEEKYRVEIPDYAIDKHTEKGEELGRGHKHFWEVAARLKNDMSEHEKGHLAEILARLEDEK
ncbi:MAG: AAA family ATPase [Candidatus Dojkabacteria bacterium]